MDDGFNIKFNKTPNTIANDVPLKLGENNATPLTPLVKITDIIMNSITNYFTKLTFNQVKEISKNLVEKFFHNKNRVKMKYLSSVFLIYQKKYKRKSFMKWKNNQLKKEYEELMIYAKKSI